MLGIFGLKSSWLQLTVQFVKSENKPSGFVWQSKFTFLNTCLNRIELDWTRLTQSEYQWNTQILILIPFNIISSGLIHPIWSYQYFTSVFRRMYQYEHSKRWETTCDLSSKMLIYVWFKVTIKQWEHLRMKIPVPVRWMYTEIWGSFL